jgi:hypothetical protein
MSLPDPNFPVPPPPPPQPQPQLTPAQQQIAQAAAAIVLQQQQAVQQAADAALAAANAVAQGAGQMPVGVTPVPTAPNPATPVYPALGVPAIQPQAPSGQMGSLVRGMAGSRTPCPTWCPPETGATVEKEFTFGSWRKRFLLYAEGE